MHEIGFGEDAQGDKSDVDFLELAGIARKTRLPMEVKTDIPDWQGEGAITSSRLVDLPLDESPWSHRHLFLLLNGLWFPLPLLLSSLPQRLFPLPVPPQRRCRLVRLRSSGSPCGQDVQGCHELRLSDLTLDLRAECPIVSRNMGPLLDEKAKRAQCMPHILSVCLSVWGPCTIFQDCFTGLDLV